MTRAVIRIETVTWLASAALLALAACSERSTAPLARKQLSTRLIVSSPVVPSTGVATVANRISRAAMTAAPNEDSLVYVSLSPGSIPGGENATIQDLATGQMLTVTMVNGGFDPVALVATVGDTLELETHSGSAVLAVDYSTVPPRRPPSLVRTDPPKGKTDVPLNTQIVIVFSEPVDPGTLSGAVRLLRGGMPIAGTTKLSPSGVVAELAPDSALAPETVYELIVDAKVRNLRGDALTSAVQVAFMTGAAGRATSLAVSGLPCNIVVTALDSAGNVATSYIGTVHFTPTDPAAVVPADYTFLSGDQGSHTFPITLSTSGIQAVGVTDAANRLSGSEAVTVDLTVLDKPLYVSNDGGHSITVYTAGASCNAAPTVTIAGSNTGLDDPADALGVAVDGLGQIYVARNSKQAPGGINIYASGAAGNVAPAAMITDIDGFLSPSGLLLDGAGSLYVASGGDVLVYAPGATGNATPVNGFSGYPFLFGIALDSSGNLYYSSWPENTILVHMAGTAAGTLPAMIAGTDTRLDGPTGLAVDKAGRLYVASTFSSSINIYAAGATGNAAPVATISGSNTGLRSPEGIAMDGAGRLYVANRGNSTITIYAAGATGNTAPIAMIGGSKTGLNEPAFVAFPSGRGTP